MHCAVTGSIHACILTCLKLLPFDLCGFHEKKDNQFMDQGKKAGKEEVLKDMREKDPKQYCRLLSQYSETRSGPGRPADNTRFDFGKISKIQREGLTEKGAQSKWWSDFKNPEAMQLYDDEDAARADPRIVEMECRIKTVELASNESGDPDKYEELEKELWKLVQADPYLSSIPDLQQEEIQTLGHFTSVRDTSEPMAMRITRSCKYGANQLQASYVLSQQSFDNCALEEEQNKIPAHILDVNTLQDFLTKNSISDAQETLSKFVTASFYAFRNGSTSSGNTPNGLGLVQYQIEGSRLFAMIGLEEAMEHLGCDKVERTDEDQEAPASTTTNESHLAVAVAQHQEKPTPPVNDLPDPQIQVHDQLPKPPDAGDGEDDGNDGDHKAFRVTTKGRRIREGVAEVATLPDVIHRCFVLASTSKLPNWQRELSNFMYHDISEDEFSSMLEEACGHSLINEHMAHIEKILGPDAEDWIFGHEEGDPLEDLIAFMEWCVDNALSKDSEKAAQVTATLFPQPKMPTPAVTVVTETTPALPLAPPEAAASQVPAPALAPTEPTAPEQPEPEAPTDAVASMEDAKKLKKTHGDHGYANILASFQSQIHDTSLDSKSTCASMHDGLDLDELAKQDRPCELPVEAFSDCQIQWREDATYVVNPQAPPVKQDLVLTKDELQKLQCVLVERDNSFTVRERWEGREVKPHEVVYRNAQEAFGHAWSAQREKQRYARYSKMLLRLGKLRSTFLAE
ncbi:unnamed protein product [Durusdinium trenchii]|uniref:Uncharacterized protein n=1 Tax=Durusdinium trenchii TaxID=1381693 RepID=A0ABP0JB38_9DINO